MYVAKVAIIRNIILIILFLSLIFFELYNRRKIKTMIQEHRDDIKTKSLYND